MSRSSLPGTARRSSCALRRTLHIGDLPGGENALRFDGEAHGANVSFFLTRNRPGTGPALHRHPYEETFIIEEGEARFTIGEETIDVRAGRIVVAPAGMAHAFVNTGEGP